LGLVGAVALFVFSFSIVVFRAPVLRNTVAAAGSPAREFTLPVADERWVSLEGTSSRLLFRSGSTNTPRRFDELPEENSK